MGRDGTASAMEGLIIPEARELGGQRSVGTMGEKGLRRKVGAIWRSWRISGVKEVLA